MKPVRLCWFALLLVGLAGCRNDGNVQVTGRVTLDGLAVESGEIRFDAADGKGEPTGSLIKDGHYEARVLPGKKRVLLKAFKKVGERPAYQDKPEGPKISITKQIAEQTLTCDITASCNQDFVLKVK